MEHRQILLGPLVLVLAFPFCISSIDTITPEQPLVDCSVLVSKEKNFVLGFFTPGNSSYVYLGIWYVKIHEKTVVWVANRDNPIKGSSEVLWIDAHGNLVLNQTNHNITLWSTNVQVSSTSGNRVAKLLNTGNLVLVEEKTDKEVWRSFDYPGNTMLPGMKLGVDLKSFLNRFLTSWKSPDDPGTGEYSVKLDTRGSPQFFLYKGSIPTWRTRSWPWTGILDSELAFFYNYSFINNDDEIYFPYTPGDDSVIMRLVVDDTGIFHTFTWLNASGQWKGFRPVSKSLCDPYGQCGAYGICDPNDVNRFECSCLPGFQPRSPGDWYLRDGPSGCVRKHGAYTCGDGGGGFLKVGKVKVPDTSSARVERGLDLRECEEACLSSCSCTGFSSISIDGESAVCLTWYGGLIDTVELSNGGWDFYVRVNAIDIAENARKSKGFLQKKGTIVIPIVSVSVALFLMAIFSYLCLMKKRKARDSLMTKVKLGESRTHTDLLFLDLSSIVSATNNFSPFNKLGEGGFGSVYKGQLPDGQEIAVKRLSKNSGQGIQEFKNEVAVIAKLQHRNLVKLLDRTRRAILDWRKRFVIIVGIARGVLYLHQDSRLRIIHRDLKTSNILLDDDMNPKISDFGMARIFGGDEIQDMTKRVVGTYGYMSPEYAAFGKFSTKSDVFSFGVILLEIISGKKNSCYYQDDPSLNLIGHVWGLWSQERALELVDSALRESFLPQEVLRCIHIGLLCARKCDRSTDHVRSCSHVGEGNYSPIP